MIKTDKDKNVKRKQFLFKMFHNIKLLHWPLMRFYGMWQFNGPFAPPDKEESCEL